MSGGTTGSLVVVSDGLVTLAEVKDYLALEITGHDTEIADRILAASKWVESYCGRKFGVATAEDRHLWANIKGTIDVVDLLGTPAPALYLDSAMDRTYATLVDPTTYEFLPYPTDASETARYQEITYLSSLLGFSRDYPIKVTGSWGYAEDDGRAPYEVRLAVLMYLARWWKRKETPIMVAQMPAVGYHRLMEDDPDAVRLLAPFVHPRKRRVLQ